jgi:hypothetical protein
MAWPSCVAVPRPSSSSTWQAGQPTPIGCFTGFHWCFSRWLNRPPPPPTHTHTHTPGCLQASCSSAAARSRTSREAGVE